MANPDDVKLAKRELTEAELTLAVARRRARFYRLGLRTFIVLSAVGFIAVVLSIVVSATPLLRDLLYVPPAAWFGGFTWPLALCAAAIWHGAFLIKSTDDRYVQWSTALTPADVVHRADAEYAIALDYYTEVVSG